MDNLASKVTALLLLMEVHKKNYNFGKMTLKRSPEESHIYHIQNSATITQIEDLDMFTEEIKDCLIEGKVIGISLITTLSSLQYKH